MPRRADFRQALAVGAVRQAGRPRSGLEPQQLLARAGVPDADLARGPETASRDRPGFVRAARRVPSGLNATDAARCTICRSGKGIARSSLPPSRSQILRSLPAVPSRRPVTTANRPPEWSKATGRGTPPRSASVHTSRPVSQSKTLIRQSSRPDPSRTRAA